MAIEVMSTLRQSFGLEIPEDVSVIGFDDTPIAALPEFSLTTLRQPINQLVASSVRLMNSMINDDVGEVENISLAPRLIERGSVKRRN